VTKYTVQVGLTERVLFINPWSGG